MDSSFDCACTFTLALTVLCTCSFCQSIFQEIKWYVFLKKGAEETSKGGRKDEHKRRKEVKKEAKGKRNKEKTVEKSYRRRVAVNQRGRGKV